MRLLEEPPLLIRIDQPVILDAFHAGDPALERTAVGVGLEPSRKIQLDPAPHVRTETEPRVRQVKCSFWSHTAEIQHEAAARPRTSPDVLLGDKQLVLGTVRHHVDALAIDHAGKNVQMGRTRDDHAAQASDERCVDAAPGRVPVEQLAPDRAAVQVHEHPAEPAGADEIDEQVLEIAGPRFGNGEVDRVRRALPSPDAQQDLADLKDSAHGDSAIVEAADAQIHDGRLVDTGEAIHQDLRRQRVPGHRRWQRDDQQNLHCAA